MDSNKKSAPEQPAFFDQPQFVVSGVTDYTYRGGHGSDSVLRSAEALANATASLSNEEDVPSKPMAEERVREKKLWDASARDPRNAELHHELAHIEEDLGKPLEAVHEYQRAAELQPTEANVFDWGADLVKHRAAAAAIEVFTKGAERYSDSVRMHLGLAVAYHLRGDYGEAARHFFAAADLNPSDATPYLFLAKIEAKEITGSDGYLERLRRFAELQPNNAWANFYYAACLWQRRSKSGTGMVADRVRLLAERAIQLDPNLASVYLLLGSIASEQNNLPAAISRFRKAVEINPDLEEAHYRLAQAYELNNEKVESQEERAIYKKLSDESAQRKERERRELQQFVVTSGNGTPRSEK